MGFEFADGEVTAMFGGEGADIVAEAREVGVVSGDEDTISEVDGGGALDPVDDGDDVVPDPELDETAVGSTKVRGVDLVRDSVSDAEGLSDLAASGFDGTAAPATTGV